MRMPKLSVNVNKIATLRNSRGGKYPSVIEFAKAAIHAGADGITVHPRPDERHIRSADVTELATAVSGVEFNIEGYPDQRYLSIIREVRPHQATLVPDPPGTLTSNAGWDCIQNQALLTDIVTEIKSLGVRVSLFLEHDCRQVEAAKSTGTDRIELYTEPFAIAFEQGRARQTFNAYRIAAEKALELGIGTNAGHDLNLQNLVIMRELPGLLEVSIGHALVIDALRMGWHQTIKAYKSVLDTGRSPDPF